MKAIFKYILLLGVGLSLYACEEKVVMLYENKPGLYFYEGDDWTHNVHQYDSIVYSFYIKETSRERDTLYLRICTMGIPSGEPRPIRLIQTNTGAADAAVAGTHYVAFDDPEVAAQMVIPAHAVMADIPFIVLRDPSMKTREFRINLEIAENEAFGVGLDAQKSFLLKVSDVTAPPANWSSWQYYLGDWGPAKMRFLIDYVGLSDFDKFSQFSQSELEYYKMKANQKLNEYNDANKTILMEYDRITPVTFPK